MMILDKKIVLAATFISVLLFSAIVGVQFFRSVAANPLPVPPLKMPEEYIDVTISLSNGTLWAKVDGTYPLYKFDIGDQDPRILINYTEFAFVADYQNILYPVPPNTTNISAKMNETELSWTNATETHPEVIHSTAIGDWPYITWGISPIPDHLVIKTHYDHPIPTKNGNYTFLYPLILWTYLNPWCNKSTAYFNVRMEINCANLNLYTVGSNGIWNPVDYTITKENTAEIITFKIVSEWSKPLPGDLVITLKDPEPETPEFPLLIILPTSMIVPLLAFIVYRRRLKKGNVSVQIRNFWKTTSHLYTRILLKLPLKSDFKRHMNKQSKNPHVQFVKSSVCATN